MNIFARSVYLFFGALFVVVPALMLFFGAPAPLIIIFLVSGLLAVGWLVFKNISNIKWLPLTFGILLYVLALSYQVSFIPFAEKVRDYSNFIMLGMGIVLWLISKTVDSSTTPPTKKRNLGSSIIAIMMVFFAVFIIVTNLGWLGLYKLSTVSAQINFYFLLGASAFLLPIGFGGTTFIDVGSENSIRKMFVFIILVDIILGVIFVPSAISPVILVLLAGASALTLLWVIGKNIGSVKWAPLIFGIIIYGLTFVYWASFIPGLEGIRPYTDLAVLGMAIVLWFNSKTRSTGIVPGGAPIPPSTTKRNWTTSIIAILLAFISVYQFLVHMNWISAGVDAVSVSVALLAMSAGLILIGIGKGETPIPSMTPS